ncbi:response regulator transcription factor [Paenibacillus sp. LHD-117]|uniref:response regulator transcription factor n=1 Tax=Paenibacillus sp. LHD-117 TaxID=3071412 RepID=UPI0027E0374B|nr:response regulator transcription factor [Paenibacillus sp. LHD-117]MDQ6418453.1 response regulator transcription factor [Paenibacillus sp. LHD-117]
MLRTIIVDDEQLSVNRLKRILAESGDVDICQTFLNPFEAYDYVKANRIHVAFLDISMPEIDGMRLSSMLLEHDASIEVVFVTAYDDYAVEAFDLSALDYIMKPVTAQRVSRTLDKIRKSYRGAAFEPVAIMPSDILTEQETKVLRLIANGLLNKEIAHLLNIGAETVKSHIKNVYRKLEVNSRVQALIRAKEMNIL